MYTSILLTLFTYINVPFAEMRETPSADSKVDSQVYYSERIEILEEQDGWTKIQSPDGYSGWTKGPIFFQTDQKILDSSNATIAKVTRCAAHLYEIADIEFGPIKTLPFDSKIEIIDQLGDPNGRWLKVRLVDGSYAYVQRGDITLNSQPISREEMLALSHRFLGLPYTWGGRSSFGYDCSGYVQMLYRQMGISIPRNSNQQAKWEGLQRISHDALQPGDLVFFGPQEPKISHVGMYIGGNKFIHTSSRENKPYLRVSSLHDPEWNGSGFYKYRIAATLKH